MSIEQLISLIFKNRPLWDQRERNHHNRYVLEKLWKEVANEMKSTSKIVRGKWKHLRDKFRIELQKTKITPRSGAGTEECVDDTDEEIQREPLPSWKYFNSLIFLREQFTPRSNKGNLEKESAITSVSNDEDINIFSPPSPASSVAGCSSTRKSNKRSNDFSKNELIASQLIEIEEKKLRLMSEDKEKEDLLFFKSLVPHVKKLSDEKKMILMMEIQKTVFSHVYGTEPRERERVRERESERVRECE